MITKIMEYGSEYELIWRDPFGSDVAEVRNWTLDRKNCRVVPIFRDEEGMQAANMRFAYLTYDKAGNPQIRVGDALMALPQNIRNAAIWHEMGHVHHEHGFSQAGAVSPRIARVEAIERGEVVATEVEADRFALAHAGRADLLAFLNFIMETRPGGTRSKLNELGRRELDRRIALVRGFGRNEPCPCGSGSKYKRCCMSR